MSGSIPGTVANPFDLPLNTVFRIQSRPPRISDNHWVAIASTPNGTLFAFTCDHKLHAMIIEALSNRNYAFMRNEEGIISVSESPPSNNTTDTLYQNQIPISVAA